MVVGGEERSLRLGEYGVGLDLPRAADEDVVEARTLFEDDAPEVVERALRSVDEFGNGAAIGYACRVLLVGKHLYRIVGRHGIEVARDDDGKPFGVQCGLFEQ